MPNHCENQFTVRGSKDDVINFIVSCVKPKRNEEPLGENQIKQAIIAGPFDDQSKYVFNNFCLFRKLKPMPKKLEETDRAFGQEHSQELIDKYGAADWYDWANANWGTKWGCYDVSFDPIYKTDTDEYEMQINYSTAWSPGDDCLMECLAVKEYEKLTFHLYYQEPGMGFHGFFFIKNGNLVQSNCENYMEFPTSMNDALERY